MNTTRWFSLLVVCASLNLIGCGGPATPPAELVELEELTASDDHQWWVREVTEGPTGDEFVERARELIDLGEMMHEFARRALTDGDVLRAERFATVSMVYFDAARVQMDASRIDGERIDAEEELVRVQEAIALRRDFIAAEDELIGTLGALQQIYAENTALQLESQAATAIQDARIEQRTSSGMFAEEFAAEPFARGSQLLDAAVAAFESEQFEEAQQAASGALAAFAEATQVASPRFQEVEQDLLRNESTRRLMERAQAEFGDEVVLDARGVVITFADLFEGRDTEPRMTDRSRLAALVPVLTAYPSYRVVIEGHTDDRGSSSSNLTLGRDRANAVRNFFIASGLASSRVTAVSAGEEHPAFDNDSSEGRRLNRRVE